MWYSLSFDITIQFHDSRTLYANDRPLPAYNEEENCILSMRPLVRWERNSHFTRTFRFHGFSNSYISEFVSIHDSQKLTERWLSLRSIVSPTKRWSMYRLSWRSMHCSWRPSSFHYQVLRHWLSNFRHNWTYQHSMYHYLSKRCSRLTHAHISLHLTLTRSLNCCLDR